jgi:hypothetical protein
MVEISMPPLAPAVADGAPAGDSGPPASPAAATSAPVALQKPAPVEAAPVKTVLAPIPAPEPAAELVPIDEPLPEPVTQLLPPAPAQPPTTAAAMPPPATETITCPECGTIAHVTVNRRESMDFCRKCDFPLFWTPAAVLRDPSGTTDESLRRLPGQAGRATVASLPCPFCYEPNALSAQTCIRCHRPMHPVEEPPPLAPVYVPPPAPVVVEQPSRVAWWVWALLALGAAALIVLVVLIATGTIG